MKKSLVFLIICSSLSLLSGCNPQTDNSVVIFTTAEEERIQYLRAEFKEKFPEYNINIQYKSNGNLMSSFQAEKTDVNCDIFYDMECTNASLISELDVFSDLSNYNRNIFSDSINQMTEGQDNFLVNMKTNEAWLVNKKVLEENELEIPTTYEALLDEKFKGLIRMPDPKISGTGYTYYNGLVSSLGEEAALEYFSELDNNITEYTSSGSAPFKAVDRGEIAVGMGMLWQAVQYANENPDLQVVFPNGESSYTLYVMGMVKGREENPIVKEVFDFLYGELNYKQTLLFTPDEIYKNQKASEIENYPILGTDFVEIQMNGLFSSEYKQDLLDKWTFS